MCAVDLAGSHPMRPQKDAWFSVASSLALRKRSSLLPAVCQCPSARQLHRMLLSCALSPGCEGCDYDVHMLIPTLLFLWTSCSQTGSSNFPAPLGCAVLRHILCSPEEIRRGAQVFASEVVLLPWHENAWEFSIHMEGVDDGARQLVLVSELELQHQRSLHSLHQDVSRIVGLPTRARKDYVLLARHGFIVEPGSGVPGLGAPRGDRPQRSTIPVSSLKGQRCVSFSSSLPF